MAENVGAVASPRLTPFTFRIFAMFAGSEDRLKEDFNPGRFFNFYYAGGSFQLLITDMEQWNNPPREGEQVWLFGVLFSNSKGRIVPKVQNVLPSSEKYPAPSADEEIGGGYFAGISQIDKTTYQKQTGETGYKFLIRGLGMLFSMAFSDEDQYQKYPGGELLVLFGRLEPGETYNSKYQRKETIFNLKLSDYKSATTQHSRASSEGRQAPNSKEK